MTFGLDDVKGTYDVRAGLYIKLSAKTVVELLLTSKLQQRTRGFDVSCPTLIAIPSFEVDDLECIS